MSEYIQIKEICDIYDGPHATPKRTLSGPVYLGIKDISKDGYLIPEGFTYLSESDYKIWTKRVTPQKNDIVFSYEATLGRYALIPENFYGCLGRRLAIIRANDAKVNIRWLYYYFQSPEWTTYLANRKVSGSTVDRISIDDFPSYYVKFPKRSTQDKIADIIGAIDRKIQINMEISAELESMAKTIYDYWFVQFDFPNDEGKPYKLSGGDMVWNEELKREIPKGWLFKPASDLTNVITGKEDANFATENGQYKFFTCSQHTLLCDTPAYKGHAILIAGNGDFNVKHYRGEFNAYQRTYILIPNDEKYYATMYFVAKDKIQAFKTGSNGSIVKFITKGDVENILIPICENDDLYETLNKLVEKIELCGKENEELFRLRDWLLPMLMSGQVTVG